MRNAIQCLLLYLLWIAAIQVAAQSTISSIPNQKLINGSYVSNPDNILDKSTVEQIDTLLAALENKTTVQVAVVAVESIGEADVFEFAQELFNVWGIGRKENNNGLLVLLVKGQRTVRFHTGDGIESTLPDVICKRIQRDYMVPEFKNENYGAGMLAGLQEVSKILTDPAYAKEVQASDSEEVSDWTSFLIFLFIFAVPVPVLIYSGKASNGRFSDSKKKEATAYPEMRIKRWHWLLQFAVIPLLIIALWAFNDSEESIALCVMSLYLYFMLTLFFRLRRMQKVIKRYLQVQDFYEIVEFLRKEQWYWFFMAIIFPIPFALYFFYHLARKRIYRNSSRNCKQCNHKMRKLGDKAEDEYLSAGQLMEENLKTVDYDVWKCTSCASIEVWFFLGRQRKYEPCPKCQTIAWFRESTRTIQSATYSSSGTGEDTYACKFCGHKKTSKYTIAQLVASSSSSSSYSSSSSSSSSWGGGSSSGGGASSSW